MNFYLDLLALATSFLALFFVFRAKKRYFFDTGFFMAVANVGFIFSLVQNLVSDLYNLPSSPILTISLISIMAGSIGIASYIVPKGGEDQKHSQSRLLPQLFTNPSRPFITFSILLLAWTASGLIVRPWKLMQTQVSEGMGYYFSYDLWWVGLSAILLVSFAILPIRSFYQKSSKVSDPKASRSMRIISICWGMFGLTTFSQTVLVQLSVLTVQTAATLVNSALFLLIAVALKEPTVLGRIITAPQEIPLTLHGRTRSDTVLLYNVESDRKPPIIKFVKDALTNDREVLCLVVKAEIPLYTAMVKGSLDTELSTRKNSINIEAVENVLSQQWNSEHYRSLFSKARREVIDLDELDGPRCSEIIEKITSMQVPLPDRRIWAVNTDSAGATLLNALVEENPDVGIIDVASQQQGFSKLLNMKHEDLVGNRILVEYQPTTNYESIIRSFIWEFRANGDSLAVFTSVGSPIYRLVNEQEDLRIFGFSTKTSTPAKISEQTVLLPERDASLLLDALDKFIRAFSGSRVGIIFDVFTDLIISQGFEKVYSPLSSVVEMSESPNVTTIFLINETAVDGKALNGVRGLFKIQVKLDANGLSLAVGTTPNKGSGPAGQVAFAIRDSISGEKVSA
jgi:hypothetical protein